jgi:O-antigen/teichoic acid export membrane protein
MLKKVLGNVSLYMTAPILIGVAGFLLLPIKAKYLTPADYGIVGILESVNRLFSIVLSFQLNSGMLRLYFDMPDDQAKRTFIGSIFWFLLLASTIGVSALGVVSYLFPHLLFGSAELTFFPFIMLQLTGLFLGQLMIVPNALFVVKQNPTKFSVVKLLTFIVSTLVGLTLIIRYHMGAVGILIANVVGCIVLLPYVLSQARSSVAFGINKGQVIQAIRYSLPFIPVALGDTLFANVDRYILERYSGIASVGLYAFSQTLVMPFSIVFCSIDQAFSPIYFQNRNTAEKKLLLDDIILILLTIIGLAVIGWVLFVGEIQPLINNRYSTSFPLVAYWGVFWFMRSLNTFPAILLLYHKKSSLILWTTLVPAVVNLLLNLVFVPRWGLNGAMAGTVLSSIIGLIVTFWLAERTEPGNYQFWPIAGITVLVILGCMFGNACVAFPVLSRIFAKTFAILAYTAICTLLVRIPIKRLLHSKSSTGLLELS